MRWLSAASLLVFAGAAMLAMTSTSAQTFTDVELQEQLLTKAAEMRDICRQLTDGAPGTRCYILTEFVDVPKVCPDPLALTRMELETAVISLNAHASHQVNLDAAAALIQQILTENPAP